MMFKIEKLKTNQKVAGCSEQLWGAISSIVKIITKRYLKIRPLLGDYEQIINLDKTTDKGIFIYYLGNF